MANINLINQRILELDGGAFQKLCEAYLYHIKGYRGLNSVGSTPTANKVRKGTPDSFFIDQNSKFIFVEMTTQKKDLLTKIHRDIQKCVNESKTLVTKETIAEIIACFSFTLTADEANKLLQEGKKNNIKVTLYGLGDISQDLYKAKAILRDYLQIHEETDQIIPLSLFQNEIGRTKYSLPIDSKFLFRDIELKGMVDYLQDQDLIVITGKPGTGKTKLGFEICKNFVEKNRDYSGFAIINISQDLLQDLNDSFSFPGKYLILVDDANRVMSFSYFMNFLKRQDPAIKIKLVVTVRDYARDKIIDEIDDFPKEEIVLSELKDEQITEFIKINYQITSPVYIERILRLSKGNLRLAAMLSKLAKEKNDLSSIHDVTTLYDEYFKLIKTDTPILADHKMLKVASIIAFFRVVDFQNEALMEEIQNHLNIDLKEFINYAIELNKFEIVDLYNNDLVKISDQILSLYIFYLATFRENISPFEIFLNNYFPKYKNRVEDVLYGLLDAFDNNLIESKVKPLVIELWNNNQTDDNLLFEFADTFSFLIQEQTLSFIEKQLERVIFEEFDYSELEKLNSNIINNINLPKEFKLLGNFKNENIELQKIAIDLFLEFLHKCPKLFIESLHLIMVVFNFSRFSNIVGVKLQQEIINKIFTLTQNGQQTLFSKLFLESAKHYLRLTFDSFEGTGRNQITIYTFHLEPTEEIVCLRKTIIDNLALLSLSYKVEVLGVLENYIGSLYSGYSKELLLQDKDFIVPFIFNNFSPDNLSEAIFVHKYITLLKNNNICFPSALQSTFTNFNIQVYELFTKSCPPEVDYKEFLESQRKEIEIFLTNKDDNNIQELINSVINLHNELKTGHFDYLITSGLDICFSILSELNLETYKNAIKYYFSRGNPININLHQCVGTFVSKFGKQYSLDFSDSLISFWNTIWKFYIYIALSVDEITLIDTKSLEQLFENSEPEAFPSDLDFIRKYMPFDKLLLQKITRIILGKKVTSRSVLAISSIFNPYSEFNRNLSTYFESDYALLQQLYLFSISNNYQDDHDSTSLAIILKINPDFATDYADWLVNNKKRFLFSDRQNFSKIWELDNYAVIIKKLIKRIFEKDPFGEWYSVSNEFFGSFDFPQNVDNISKKIEVLKELIYENIDDFSFTKYIFFAVNTLPSNSRLQIIKTFLEADKCFEHFEELPIEFMPRSWTGSEAPIIQEQIENLSQILTLFDSKDYLRHRVYIRERINYLEGKKAQVLRKDFIGW